MSPTTHYRGKITPTTPPIGESVWLKWVPALAFVGGAAGALVASFFHRRELALGLIGGSVLTVLNYFSLKFITEKLIRPDTSGGRKAFWLWNFVRWLLLGLGCWALLSVSPACLGGAFLSYLWFLIVLGFAGWTFSKPNETALGRSKFF